MYKPDFWKIIKVNSPTDPHYRVFATWMGSYTEGESWRMNSGITRVEKDEDYFYFYGSSGSCYACYWDGYRTSVYTQGVLEGYKKKYPIEELSSNTDWMEIDWIIKDEKA